MGCLICYESLFKVQGSAGHKYYLEHDSNEDMSERPAALCCGHVYHKECIEGWFRNGYGCRTCPLCQKWPERLPCVLFIDLEEQDVRHIMPEASDTNDKAEDADEQPCDDVGDIINRIYQLMLFCPGLAIDKIENIVKQVSLVAEKIKTNAQKLNAALETASSHDQKLEKLQAILDQNTKRVGLIRKDLRRKCRRIELVEEGSNNIFTILQQGGKKSQDKNSWRKPGSNRN